MQIVHWPPGAFLESRLPHSWSHQWARKRGQSGEGLCPPTTRMALWAVMSPIELGEGRQWIGWLARIIHVRQFATPVLFGKWAGLDGVATTKLYSAPASHILPPRQRRQCRQRDFEVCEMLLIHKSEEDIVVRRASLQRNRLKQQSLPDSKHSLGMRWGKALALLQNMSIQKGPIGLYI